MSFRQASAAGMAALCLGGGALAAPVAYRLDPDHTWLQAEVLHFGTSTIRVRFGPLSGSAVLDREAHAGEVSLAIDMAGVDSGSKLFDARLQRPDLLATAEFPQAWFVSRRFTFEGDTPTELRGELTFKGISQPLSLRALRFSCRTDDRGELCGGDFEGQLNRSDFNANFGAPLVGDAVRLVVRVEARRE